MQRLTSQASPGNAWRHNRQQAASDINLGDQKRYYFEEITAQNNYYDDNEDEYYQNSND